MAATSVDPAARPTGYFSRPLTAGHAVVPLLVAIGVAVALSVAYRPYFAEALARTLPADAAGARVEAIQNQVFRFSLIGSVLVPIVYAAITAMVAFLWLAATAARDLPRFAPVLACAAWASLALVLKDVARYGVVHARGFEAVDGALDLRPGVGVGFLVSDRASLVYELLDLINAFDAAYLAVLGVAISHAARVSPACGFVAAVLPWALLNGVRIGFAVLIPR